MSLKKMKVYKVVCKSCGKEFEGKGWSAFYVSAFCGNCKRRVSARKVSSSYEDSLQAKVAMTLQKAGVGYRYGEPLEIGGKLFFPDFLVQPLSESLSSIVLEVFEDGQDKAGVKGCLNKVKKYLSAGLRVVLVVPKDYAGWFRELDKDARVSVVEVENRKMHVLSLGKITDVDYAHFLPDYDGKCSQVHAHTSYNVGVKIWGYKDTIKRWVLDFKELKKVVKEVVDLIDHKLVVGLAGLDKVVSAKKRQGYWHIRYQRGNKKHYLCLPEDEVLVLTGLRATVEDISWFLCSEVLNRLPSNVVGVELSMKEGVNNGCKACCFRDKSILGFDKLVEVIEYYRVFSDEGV